MQLVTEDNITDLAVERWATARDPRTAELMTALAEHPSGRGRGGTEDRIEHDVGVASQRLGEFPGQPVHVVLLRVGPGGGRRPQHCMHQGMSTSRTPTSPEAWRRHAAPTSASGTTSWATARRPAAAFSATAVTAARRCSRLSALFV